MTRIETVEELAARCGFVFLDANALIYSLEPASEQARINDPEVPLAEKQALIASQAAAIIGFYEWWRGNLEGARSLVVTDATLDLELSAWRTCKGEASHYRKRFRVRFIPRGDLLKPYDPEPLRVAKGSVLARLDAAHRVNRRLRRASPGLRGLIEERLFTRPLWRQAFTRDGLSLVDRDLALNALAAGTVGAVAVLTNDRALAALLSGLVKNLRDPSWAKGGPAEAAAQQLAATKVEVCSWQRDGPSRLRCLGP